MSHKYITFDHVGPDYEVGELIKIIEGSAIKVHEAFEKVSNTYVVEYVNTTYLRHQSLIAVENYVITAKNTKM